MWMTFVRMDIKRSSRDARRLGLRENPHTNGGGQHCLWSSLAIHPLPNLTTTPLCVGRGKPCKPAHHLLLPVVESLVTLDINNKPRRLLAIHQSPTPISAAARSNDPSIAQPSRLVLLVPDILFALEIDRRTASSHRSSSIALSRH